MKYYCYNNNVEIYNKQPLLKDAIIFTILNSSETDLEYVKDFVKNNGDKCKNSSYITLVKGTRKKFIKNNKSKIKILEKATKPLYFHTLSEREKEEPIMNETHEDKPITNETPKDEPLVIETPEDENIINETPKEVVIETCEDNKCGDCDNLIEQFKKETKNLIGIKVGDKLYLNNDELSVDNSYNGFSRMIKNIFWSGYNRNNVIEKLEKTFELELTLEHKEKMKEYMIEVKKGLTNLLETYIDDKNIKVRLSNIINKLY
jgi:hypothetical protein